MYSDYTDAIFTLSQSDPPCDLCTAADALPWARVFDYNIVMVYWVDIRS